jgi:hypothetical protein
VWLIPFVKKISSLKEIREVRALVVANYGKTRNTFSPESVPDEFCAKDK